MLHCDFHNGLQLIFQIGLLLNKLGSMKLKG